MKIKRFEFNMFPVNCYVLWDDTKEALSPQANNNIAAVAEFDVLGANGKPVSREHWKIRYADSEETRSGNRTADKIFDLQESTFWMTRIYLYARRGALSEF